MTDAADTNTNAEGNADADDDDDVLTSNVTSTSKGTASDPMERYIANNDDRNITTYTMYGNKSPRLQSSKRSNKSRSPGGKDNSKVVFAQNLSFLSLPALSSSSMVTLDQCLKHYTHREKLDDDNAWYCSKCKKHQRAEKSVSLWKLPKVLVITLKRFDFHSLNTTRGEMTYNEKIDTFVDFPVQSLSMYPYLSKNRRSRSRTFSNLSVAEIIGRGSHMGSSNSTHVDGNSTETVVDDDEEEFPTCIADTMYDLFAVCNHVGRSG